MTLGGYIQKTAIFTPIGKEVQSLDVLVFVATAQSKYWLGHTPEKSIAKQVGMQSYIKGLEYITLLTKIKMIHS